jgi:hypothetical protein
MGRDLEDIFPGEGIRRDESRNDDVINLGTVIGVDYVRPGCLAGLVRHGPQQALREYRDVWPRQPHDRECTTTWGRGDRYDRPAVA